MLVNSSLNCKIINSDHYSYHVVQNANCSICLQTIKKRTNLVNVENQRRKEKQVEKQEGLIIYKIFCGEIRNRKKVP